MLAKTTPPKAQPRPKTAEKKAEKKIKGKADPSKDRNNPEKTVFFSVQSQKIEGIEMPFPLKHFLFKAATKGFVDLYMTSGGRSLSVVKCYRLFPTYY